MDSSLIEVKLDTLGGGAAAELFAREWERVLENIMDPNTPAKAKRKVVLTVTIEPDESRESAFINIDATSKVCPAKPAQRRVFIGRDRGRPIAVDNVQYAAFPQETGPSVTPITARKEG